MADQSGAQTFEGGLLDWPVLLVFLLGAGLLLLAPFLGDEATDALLVGALGVTISLPVLTLLTRRRVTIDREGVEFASVLRRRLAWDAISEVGIVRKGPKLYFAERVRRVGLRGIYARDFPAKEALIAIAELMQVSRPDFADQARTHAGKVPPGRTPSAPERWLRRWGYRLSLLLLVATAALWVVALS